MMITTVITTLEPTKAENGEKDKERYRRIKNRDEGKTGMHT